LDKGPFNSFNPILQIPRRGGYSTYQIPAQHCLYNSAYIIEIRQNDPLGGRGLLSTPTSFSISKNIVNLQSNGILFNIKNITCWKAPKDSKNFYSWSTQTEQQQELLIG
jgi:hypothetical protein